MVKYENLGNAIEVNIKDNYWVAAFINTVNRDNSEYICNLHIRDKNSGFMVEIDKSFNFKAKYNTVRVEAAKMLLVMNNNGDFNDNVTHIKNLQECMEALLLIQNRNKEH